MSNVNYKSDQIFLYWDEPIFKKQENELKKDEYETRKIEQEHK